MNVLKKNLEKIFTFYLSGTEYHMETYDGHFSMIQSIEDLESLLKHLSEEEIHDTPIEERPRVVIDNVECVEFPLSYLRKEEINWLIKEYEVSLNTQQDSKDGHIHDNPVEEFLEEPLFGDIVENHPCITLTENNEDLEKLQEPIEQHIPSDPIEYVHKGSLIEDIIEDPLHDTIIETIENLECSHEYSIDNDHSFFFRFTSRRNHYKSL